MVDYDARDGTGIGTILPIFHIMLGMKISITG